MPAFGAFAEEQIDDLVGDAVADLVRMALGNGFAGEQIGLDAHTVLPICWIMRRRSTVDLLQPS